MRHSRNCGGQLTFIDVTLNHDTHDTCLTLGDLLGQDVRDLGLVLVILLRVAVAAVNHQARVETLLLEVCARILDADLIVVCALLSTAQNDEAVLVTDGTDNGDNTGLRDGEEVVRVLDRANGVNGDTKGAICAVLEAHREGQARSKLTVELRLGRPGADGTNTEQIGQELRRDGIQHLAGQRHALLSQVNEELS
jgi:hypothetical protein